MRSFPFFCSHVSAPYYMPNYTLLQYGYPEECEIV